MKLISIKKMFSSRKVSQLSKTAEVSILIVAPAWVGDMVMAQGLFRLLKWRYPHCVIDVLAPRWTFALLDRMPEVRQGIEMPVGHGKLALSERYRVAKILKQHRYQWAIVLPNSFKSALIPWFARIPLRTGFRGELRYGVLNDIRQLNKQQYPLMIQRFLALGISPGMTLPSPLVTPKLKTDAGLVRKAFEKYGLQQTNQPILGLAPGAAFGPSKRWPAPYFAKVAKEKCDAGWIVWLFGSKNEAELCDTINELTGGRCINLAGLVPLDDTIDLFSAMSGLVTNDSGLMHVAAALNVPLVAVYGSTSPAFTPPLSDHATIVQLSLPCQPCFERTCPLKHHHCMTRLLPDRVLAAMKDWG